MNLYFYILSTFHLIHSKHFILSKLSFNIRYIALSKPSASWNPCTTYLVCGPPPPTLPFLRRHPSHKIAGSGLGYANPRCMQTSQTLRRLHASYAPRHYFHVQKHFYRFESPKNTHIKFHLNRLVNKTFDASMTSYSCRNFF